MQSVAQGLSGAPAASPQGDAAARTLRLVASDISDAADDLEEQKDEPKPNYLRGDFGANLVDPRSIDNPVSEAVRMRIAGELLRGIEADKQSRKEWDKMAERAIEFLGLIYEEASGDATAQGSVSKAWATIMLEAALGFWANAYAEFLPADGPVKIRDDQPAPPTIGHNGGPPLDDAEDASPEDQDTDRTALAEAFERDYNRYLLVGDKQYYRDFSRMLWSLGPIGTEFRKVYYNPLRKLPVSEWVKSANLIVSNEAADISTAQRITERIPNFLQADVKRLQWMGWWLDVDLTTPTTEPTSFEKKVGETEGVRPTIDLPEDHPHTILECYAQRDLPGFEHEDDEGEPSGLPLPYRFTIDETSRQILEIRRNWREGDEDFRARQRYVMFGLVPGFGLYYLGFAHLLGNTERAATALTREMIDVGMMSIFPAWLAEKSALPRGTTQIRLGPMGVMEIDTQMRKSVADALMAVPVKPLDPNVLALLEKLERNGRNVSGKLEIPSGEGTQNIPVGTMIAIVEQGTKVMMAVHKGLHASRAEELELLRELIAEDPSSLTRNIKSPSRKEWLAEEFRDLDLVPSSDPNTPSHVHRLMRGIGLAQISQMFPQLMNQRTSRNILDTLLRILQVQNPSEYEPTPEEMAQMGQNQPDTVTPQAIAAKAKVQVAQIQAQSKAHDTEIQQQTAADDRMSKERIAQVDLQNEAMKSHAQVQAGILKQQHDSANAERDRQHEAGLEGQRQQHEAGMASQQQQHDASQGLEQRAHEKETASLSQPTPNRKF